jgi:hypothetical protein
VFDVSGAVDKRGCHARQRALHQLAGMMDEIDLRRKRRSDVT